jgi:hypothetical protein
VDNLPESRLVALLFPGATYLVIAIYSLLKWSASWGDPVRLKNLLSRIDASLIDEDDDNDKSAIWVIRGIAVGCGAMGVGFLEATIAKNNITFPDTHLLNSGQLMPLLIGIFTLVVTICDALKASPRGLLRKDKATDGSTETVDCIVQVNK